MNDEQFFLANAYLDGELTVEERAIADADPDVMAAVEELRALQALVRDVDPPSSATRDAAVAAAMATFAAGDTTDSGASHVRTVPAPIPFRRRPSYAKYLAVAAGVLGVGLFGVAVANLDTGGDDDSADESAELAEAPAAELDRATEDQPLAADGGDDADQEVATAEASNEEAADEPAMDAADEPAMDAADEPADEPAEEPAEEPATGPSLPRPEVTPGQVLTTPEELGSYGTDLLEQERDGTLGPTPNHACPIDDVLGRAEYQVGDEIVPILVAVDEPDGIVLAFTDETCEVVADGPLYLP